MLVNRRTFIVKKPYFEEAQRLLVELGQLSRNVAPDATFRVYASEFGRFDTVAFEFEVANLATLEQQLASFDADAQVSGRMPEWFRRWLEITESGGTNEIWRLVE